MDPLSLTLTIGPILIKAAKVAKLCQEVQVKIKSAPATLASIITECSGVNHVLVEIQNLGLQDLSFLDADLRQRFGDGIDNLAVGCTSVLSTIEKHIEEFQDSEDGPVQKMGLKEKIKVVWKEDEIQQLLQTLRGHQSTLSNSLSLLHMQINLNRQQLTEMQGTVLTMLFQQSREQARHRRPGADQESENVSDRFSVLSTSSNITDTSFSFDQEALSSPIYHQARMQKMCNPASIPSTFRNDRVSIQAVASLSENASYYNEIIEASEEITVSGSAELEAAVDKSINQAAHEDKTLDTERPLSFVTEISEDGSNNRPSHNSESRQGMVDHNLVNLNAPKEKKNLSPSKLQETGKVSRLTRLIRRPNDKFPVNFSGLTANANKFLRSSPTSSTQLDPESLYLVRATNTIKLVLVGDSGYLKTKLLITYATETFPSEYIPTVFDNYAVTLMIKNEKWTLGCWDTAGQEDYDRLRPLSYPETDVFMICVNRSRPSEYESAKSKWAPELKHHLPHIPKILVGVGDPEDESTIDRMDYGTRLGKEIGAEKYLECDPLTMKGVREVFNEAIETALNRVLTKDELKMEKIKARMAQQEAAHRKKMEGIKE